MDVFSAQIMNIKPSTYADTIDASNKNGENSQIA